MPALAPETELHIARTETAVSRSAAARGIRPERPLEEVLEDIRRTRSAPARSRDPRCRPEAYTSQAFYRWEVGNVFQAEWLCLAHLSQLPKAGDFLTLDLLGEPLLVVHGKDGAIRVLSRVCPHRGMDIMPPGFGRDTLSAAEATGSPGCGHTRLFLCPYHSWTFELDGKLKACPEMQQAAGFVRDDHALRAFRSEIWNGFIFVNLGGSAPPLGERLGAMNADFGQWNPAEMEIVIQRSWELPVQLEGARREFHGVLPPPWCACEDAPAHDARAGHLE